MDYLLLLSQDLCEIPAETEGRFRLEGCFHHERVWWRDKLEKNQVMCPVNQCSSIMGDTNIACDFFSVVLCLLGL